eukprot:2230684-Prymnesium_polylepis.3
MRALQGPKRQQPAGPWAIPKPYLAARVASRGCEICVGKPAQTSGNACSPKNRTGRLDSRRIECLERRRGRTCWLGFAAAETSKTKRQCQWLRVRSTNGERRAALEGVTDGQAGEHTDEAEAHVGYRPCLLGDGSASARLR